MPVLLATVIGALIAIWTGVFVARLVAFDQARMEAVRILTEIPALWRCESFAELKNAEADMALRLLRIAFEFVRLRQIYAHGMVQYLAIEVGSDRWKGPAKEEFPLKSEARHGFFERLSPYGLVYSAMLFDLRPKIYPLVTIRWGASSMFSGFEYPETVYRAVEEQERRQRGLGSGADAGKTSLP